MSKAIRVSIWNETATRREGFITIAEWARKLGITVGAAHGRFAQRFSPDEHRALYRYVKVHYPSGPARTLLFISTANDVAVDLMTRVDRQIKRNRNRNKDGAEREYNVLLRPAPNRDGWRHRVVAGELVLGGGETYVTYPEAI